MDKYEAVRDQIQRARIERSVYLAELIADAITTAWARVTMLADSVGEGSQTHFGRHVVSVDA